MFEPSEKVIVLTSSSTGWAGAKRGSIGYVKPNNSNIHISKIHSGLSICMSLLDLMIVRYGFGKERKKHESVTVINTFPIFDKPFYDDASIIVKGFLSKMRGQDFNSDKWAFLKSKLGSPSKLEVCVAAPVIERQVDILKVNKVNFTAWFESVIWSGSFFRGLHQLDAKRIGPKYDPGVREYLSALKRCLTDRGYKEQLISAAMDSWNIKHNLVLAIKLMNSVSASSALRSYKLKINKGYTKGRYHHGSYAVREFFYPMLARGIFSDHLFKYNCELMDKCSMDSKDIKYRIRRTRIMLRKEAQALLRVKY